MMDQPTRGDQACSQPAAAAPVYQIRLKGCLAAETWADSFGSLSLSLDAPRAETILCGPVADQAELYGLLARLRDLGLPLIAVEMLDQGQTAAGQPPQPTCQREA